jgi:hypothetical protein
MQIASVSSLKEEDSQVQLSVTAARHDSSATTAPNSNRELQYRGQNEHAVGFIKYALGNAIRSIENFLHHFPSIFNAI